MSGKQWFAAEVTVPASAHEAIEYGLMEAGATGTETKDAGSAATVTGYFDQQIDAGDLRTNLVAALKTYGLREDELKQIRQYAVAERDWLAEWKKNWQPVVAGRFVVTPPWLVSGPGALATGSSGPLTILIEPGMAFGTGTHETTRLCLKAIEKYFRGGSFLDVGTGTGILAIAAAKAFPDAQIAACDTDAEAIEIARENARLNEVAGRIEFRVGTVAEGTPSADFVCANLTAPVIVELLPKLIGATCGRLVLSGILETQTEMVRSRFSEAGIIALEIEQDGEWISMVI